MKNNRKLFPVYYSPSSLSPIQDETPWKYCLRRIGQKMYVDADPLELIEDIFTRFQYLEGMILEVGDLIIQPYNPEKIIINIGIEPDGSLIKEEITSPFFGCRVVEKIGSNPKVSLFSKNVIWTGIVVWKEEKIIEGMHVLRLKE